MTPEEQAAELLPLFQQKFPNSTQGKNVMANCVVIRGAKSAQRGTLFGMAVKHSPGFVVEIQQVSTYFVIKLSLQSQSVPRDPETMLSNEPYGS